MKILNTKEDFKDIPVGGKITLIRHGKTFPYRFMGEHPLKSCENYFVAISDANHLEAKVFKYDISIRNKREVWISGYDSKGVGEIMIQQHEEHIASIKEIYLKENK